MSNAAAKTAADSLNLTETTRTTWYNTQTGGKVQIQRAPDCTYNVYDWRTNTTHKCVPAASVMILENRLKLDGYRLI